MFGMPEIMRVAAASASNAADRLDFITQNIANADTPGYRARDILPFSQTYEAVSGTGEFALRTTRAGHVAVQNDAPMIHTARSTGHMSPNGNTVSLEDEMMKAAVVRQDHDTALAIYRSSMSILRASLGRR